MAHTWPLYEDQSLLNINQISSINSNPTIENPAKKFIVTDTETISLKSTLFEVLGSRTYIPKDENGNQYSYSIKVEDYQNADLTGYFND